MTDYDEESSKELERRFSFGTKDLEEALRGPESNETRRAVLERFAQIDQTLKASMDKGLQPSDFHDHRILREALKQAGKIITAFK